MSNSAAGRRANREKVLRKLGGELPSAAHGPLTAAQFEVMALVYRADVAGRPVSLRELTAAIGARSTFATTCRLRGAAAKGAYLSKPFGTARTLHVTAIPVFSGDPAQIVGFIPRGAP